MLSYFFKTFSTDPVNPLTKLLSINKIITQLFAKPLKLIQPTSSLQVYDKKKKSPIISHPIKQYYLIKPLVNKNINVIKSKK
jgi:hypothetical protein